MGKHYDQLDLEDRIEISRLQTAGRSRREIGRLAITRNGVKFGLWPQARRRTLSSRFWMGRLVHPRPCQKAPDWLCGGRVHFWVFLQINSALELSLEVSQLDPNVSLGS